MGLDSECITSEGLRGEGEGMGEGLGCFGSSHEEQHTYCEVLY